MRLQTIVDRRIYSLEMNVSFDFITDVLVVGLGTAGALSAITAAEQGVSVIGVERTAFLGGMGTAACVYDYYYGTQGGRVIPINEECYRMIGEKKYASSGGRSFRDESLPAAVKDDALRKYALKAGCKLLLQSSVIGVFMENDTVCGAQIYDGNRRINIGCRVLIDGTDGIVCKLAGCEFEYGRPSDAHTIKFSHMISELGKHGVRGGWYVYGFPEASSTAEWTRMILDSAPEYRGGRYACEASLLGLREVPTVITDEVCTMEAHASEKRTEEPLFYGFSKVDNLNGDYENETATLQDWEFICKMGRYGISVGIPVGTMIPRGRDGLMIVSRAKGLGHDMASCIRMKYDMEKSGEAAGYVAALACKNGCSLREVKYGDVAPLLLKSGCLDPSHDIGICDLNEPYRDEKGRLFWKTVTLPEDLDGIMRLLSSREPGPMMWRLRNRCSEKEHSALIEWMNSDDRLLRESCAITLGMRADTSAVPALREILKSPPIAYYYSVSEVKNIFGWLMDSPFCNYSKAILLLGRFKDKESLPLLKAILEDGGIGAASSMSTEDGCPSKEAFAAEFAAYASAAIREISP